MSVDAMTADRQEEGRSARATRRAVLDWPGRLWKCEGDSARSEGL